MACSSGQVTIEAILDNVKCDKVRQQVVSSQLGRLRSLPRKAWGILNKWALEILAERGTVDVQNFMRVGWQRFRALDGEVRFIALLMNHAYVAEYRSVLWRTWIRAVLHVPA